MGIKLKIRNLLWNLLGHKHQVFLNNQRRITYLDDFKQAKIGYKTYNNGAKVWKWNKESTLAIGKYCAIANDVNFILDPGNHDMFKITTFPLLHSLYKDNELVTYKNKDVTFSQLKKEYTPSKHSINILNEVWIGAGATILPGVTIGNGAVVLAGSVVSKSVEDYSVVGGIPAQHMYYRHPKEFHLKLNQIAWWNWSDEKIKDNIADFNLNSDEFVKKHTRKNEDE